MKVRLLEVKDSHLLVEWLSDHSVLEFYEGRDKPFDVDKVKSVFYSSEDNEIRCIVEYANKAIGYVQFYQLDEETKIEYVYSHENVYGTDQFIGEVEYWNKGIGTLLVRAMIKFLMEYEKADRVVMDPQTRNTRAIKCYEKCGFNKVKTLPKREIHEGIYQDCWLMEYHK